MTRFIISAALFLISCQGENQHLASDKKSALRDTSRGAFERHNKVANPAWVSSDSCEVVKIDSTAGRFQGVFVVTKTQLVYDISFIRQTICKLKTSYSLDDKSHVSFFSEKKYAGYKDELFFNSQRSLPESEYPKWLENYYLGEFDSGSLEYVAYPASYKVGKRKVFNIAACP